MSKLWGSLQYKGTAFLSVCLFIPQKAEEPSDAFSGGFTILLFGYLFQVFSLSYAGFFPVQAYAERRFASVRQACRGL